MKSLLFHLLLPGWLLLVPAVTASAQAAPRISAVISARTMGPGQQAVLSYNISGGEQGVERYPEVIRVEGLSITYSGQSRRMVMNNGILSSETGIRYLVESGEAGEYAIPPQSFVIDGVEIPSPPLTLTVTGNPQESSGMFPSVRLSLGSTEFWKGEVIPVDVEILVHPAVQPLSQFFPQVKSANFAVNRFDRSAGLEAREVDGEVWRAWQMGSVMTALRAGVQEFGPAEIKAEFLIPTAGSVNGPFGRQSGSRRTTTLTSNAVSVNVKELPVDGKPDGFSGAVGQFEIELAASPVSLEAGDPVSVEITVSGTGNFDALTAPEMESKDGWRLYAPRISQENRGWGTDYGRMSFSQILIPEKSLTEIPSFVLHYFDPASGQYLSKKSNPVALTITGEFKAEQAVEGEARDFAAPADAMPPIEELGDILDRPLGGAGWITTAAGAAPVNPWLLHGVPAALLALLLGSGLVSRVRAGMAAHRPREGAPRPPHEILGELRSGDGNRRRFYALIHEYLGSLEWHHQRQPAAGEGFSQLLAARDRWLYGPENDALRQKVPADERRQMLAVLNRIQPVSPS